MKHTHITDTEIEIDIYSYTYIYTLAGIPFTTTLTLCFPGLADGHVVGDTLIVLSHLSRPM